MSELRKLSEEQKAKFLEHLNSKWPKKVCSICGYEKWSAGDTLIELKPFIDNQGTILIGGIVYPHVMITCENCGQTLLINAIRIGLMPSSKIG